MNAIAHSTRVKLAGDSGLYGTVDAIGLEPHRENQVCVRLDDGRILLVPRDALALLADGSYELQLDARTLEQFAETGGGELRERVVIPVVAETLRIDKREVETGRVRVTKLVSEREELVEQLLRKDEVTVERVPVGRVLTEPATVREEGDTLIIPLVEEVLVVEKRLVLREELRVTRRTDQVSDAQRVTLRREDVEIERIPLTRKPENGTGVA